jgi:hypothetical protein
MEYIVDTWYDIFADCNGIRDDINQLNQCVYAVENLKSVLNNYRTYGHTPSVELLLGDQIEWNETSLEGMIANGIRKIIDFIKGIIEKIKDMIFKSDTVLEKQLDMLERVELKKVELKKVELEHAELKRVSLDGEKFAISVMRCVKEASINQMWSKFDEAKRIVDGYLSKVVTTNKDDTADNELEILGKANPIYTEIRNALELITGKFSIAECKYFVKTMRVNLRERKKVLELLEKMRDVTINAEKNNSNMDLSLIRTHITQLSFIVTAITKHSAISATSIRKAIHRSKYFTPGGKTEDEMVDEVKKDTNHKLWGTIDTE